MLKKLLVGVCGLGIGISIGIVYLSFIPQNSSLLSGLAFPKKEVIGFLPYWQTNTAKTDYSTYITTLTYFGLALGSDGKILKLANPQQLEPGWNALASGKVAPFLSAAKKKNVSLSLLIFSGNTDTILAVLSNPAQHAQNLLSDIEPIMHHYGFSDVNLDIEYTADASPSAQTHFTQFISAIKKYIPSNQTLTVEVMSTDAIKKNLIDLSAVGKIADHIVVMAYDYHAPDSFVTGPIAPLAGANVDSEYDVTTALQQAVKQVSAGKVILGIPLYGYEWESLAPFSRSAVIAGSGVIASNHRGEELLATCSTCSAQMDTEAEELHMSYLDTDTDTYHQLFIPTKASTQAKITLANTNHIGGLALWALGYEGDTILQPLIKYR